VANGAQTLSEIAVRNNLTLEELYTRNPEYAEEEESFVPPAGKALLLQRAQPFLRVQVSFRRSRVEEIPFTTREAETLERAKGVRKVVVEGVPGRQEVWEDFYYVDGELARVDRLEEMTAVLSHPVERVIEVGIYDFSDVVTLGPWQPAYMFPVPDSTWGSRATSAYHRGVDINGPVGTPIYASNAGVVVSAGWHYSWGYNIVIEHPDGLSTRYAHLSSMAVEVGQVLKQGQYIGGMGSTGNSTGSHLHLEFMYNNGSLLNPLDYVPLPPGFYFGWRGA
jgi:murein DD-endopeptidase MepM/ murein hydrolase activator NlpD